MTEVAIVSATSDGFATVQVDTGALALTIIPALGGKISSLRDQRSGREWLWRHPRMAYRQVAYGSSYVATADTGGWDECFPTVAPCGYPSAPWAGAALQDHGELWSQPAALEVFQSAEHAALRTHWQGVALPYTFERIVTLTAGSSRLRVEYTASNSADQPLQYIWCIHPLLAIAPGMQLHVPPTARFHTNGSLPPGLLGAARDLAFPPALTGQDLDLGTMPDPAAAVAFKFWSDPLDAGWATLQASDGALHMRWDVALLPQLALWMNLGAWAGDGGTPYYNLGLEPCIGAQDALDEAVTIHHMYQTLPAHDSRSWWLELELSV